MKQWYALRTKPRHETLTTKLLTGAGIDVYFPQESVHRQHGKPPVLEPYFPGYLFGRLDREQAEIRLASYTPGVLYVVGYGEEPWPVPDDMVEIIRRRLAGGRGMSERSEYRRGDRLVIASGPLKGLEGVFDRHLSASGRVRVLVQILKRLCPAEVHVRQLRRVSQAARPTSTL